MEYLIVLIENIVWKDLKYENFTLYFFEIWPSDLIAEFRRVYSLQHIN